MSTEQRPQTVKRTRLRSEERRISILYSAKRVFARSSYAEASTSELARESEVTEPMLYKHFGSKKGLFQAVLREFSGQLLKAFQERIAQRSEESILDALEHVVDDYITGIKADPDIQRVLFQAVTEAGDPDIAGCVSRHNHTVHGLVRQLVERAHDEGYLDPTMSLDGVAWGYMSMIFAIQYSVMLDLSQDVMHAQKEISRIWQRGLLLRED